MSTKATSRRSAREEAPILCGVDFSEGSKDAIKTAALLARRIKVPLVLAHVYDPSETWAIIDSDSAAMQRLNMRLMDLADATQAQYRGIVRAILLKGVPDEKLCELACLTHARLIVLSALGNRNATKWLLGSVSERVAQLTTLPLLIVRNSAPFEAAVELRRPLKTLVGVDFSLSSDCALAALHALSRLLPLDVVALHKAQESVVNGDALLRKRIRAFLERQRFELLIETRENSVGELILRAARRVEAGLIVTGTHQRTGIDRFWSGSVSERVMHEKSANVLMVPFLRHKAK